MPDNLLTEIEKTEAAHFDKLYSIALQETANLKVPEKLLDRFSKAGYNAVEWKEYAFYLLGNLKGKKILDYGCGMGVDSICLAKRGAFVTAFDVSQEAIKLTELRAKENNVQDKLNTVVMSGNKLNFQPEEFDAIYGCSILHHLDLLAACNEIQRILKKGGKAVFLEPVINSKGLDTIKNVIKKILPSKNYIGTYDTEHEEPLNYEKIAIIGAKFKHVHYREFFLFAKLETFFPNETFVRILQTADYLLFKCLPFTRKYGTGVVIELTK